MPIGRYVIAGLLTAAAVSGLLLLIRPLLFSLAGPRDDTNYTVASAAAANEGPMLVELVLNERHELLGEVHRGEQTGLTVVVAPVGTTAYSVVGAWSPTNDCALSLGADRLRDCEGDAWTFDGVPLDPADPHLQAFPTRVSNGAVLVDFTRPISGPAT
ncbi:MAG TPA: hypothetical protein VI733_04070 [Candidatus Limnocylindria bacterium]|nr:hypothetical protein [Candidatus Limnocylindria bacterium]